MTKPKTILFALALAAGLAACSDSSETSQAPASDAAAASPEPAPFYVGEWAADPVWCTDQSEGFPITITETQFNGRENICDMSEIESTPEGGVTAQLSCVAEGETVREPISIAQAGEDIAINWPDRGTETTIFSRCE